MYDAKVEETNPPMEKIAVANPNWLCEIPKDNLIYLAGALSSDMWNPY